jgi:hypothetical protein
VKIAREYSSANIANVMLIVRNLISDWGGRRDVKVRQWKRAVIHLKFVASHDSEPSTTTSWMTVEYEEIETFAC